MTPRCHGHGFLNYLFVFCIILFIFIFVIQERDFAHLVLPSQLNIMPSISNNNIFLTFKNINDKGFPK